MGPLTHTIPIPLPFSNPKRYGHGMGIVWVPLTIFGGPMSLGVPGSHHPWSQDKLVIRWRCCVSGSSLAHFSEVSFNLDLYSSNKSSLSNSASNFLNILYIYTYTYYYTHLLECVCEMLVLYQILCSRKGWEI